jgi:hypothetical protein
LAANNGSPRAYKSKGLLLTFKYVTPAFYAVGWIKRHQTSFLLDVLFSSSLPEFDMTTSTVPAINLRNSVTECAQSLKKENAGKFYNYGIRDCAASIAALKAK